jgi:translation initiation factor 2B subunit (eIF-2B alpha/beta/delta family)
MDGKLREAIEALARDAESGASELVERALGILEHARQLGPNSVTEAARGVCYAQPAMASMWNAAIAALADAGSPGTFARFTDRLRRSPAALRRVAVEELEPASSQPLRIVTCSFSGSVLGVLAELAESRELTVACAEGRPRFEGRRMAAALASTRATVEFFTDAAVPLALRDSTAVLVGADAITPAWFLNKVGTLSLAMAASRSGVPVFVLATRDKFLPPALFDGLPVADGAPGEVWADAPEGVLVRNPYFERVPLDLATGVVTDVGVLGTEMVEEACRAIGTAARPDVLDGLRVGM